MPAQTPAVGMERKLAAIFSTDVAGYSRLMGEDEEATIRTFTRPTALMMWKWNNTSSHCLLLSSMVIYRDGSRVLF